MQRLCQGPLKVDAAQLDTLVVIWLVSPEQRSTDMLEVAAWDEAFHCALVAAAGNAEMVRVHREVTKRIRVIRWFDFTQPLRTTATDEVRKITLHQVHLARQLGAQPAAT